MLDKSIHPIRKETLISVLQDVHMGSSDIRTLGHARTCLSYEKSGDV